MSRCFYNHMGPSGLESKSGPTVWAAAMSLALKDDERFCPIGSGEPKTDDVLWFSVLRQDLLAAIEQQRRVAIGPHVLYASCLSPGSSPAEKRVMMHEDYVGIFSSSRWCLELLRLTMAQKTGFGLVDYPLPEAWLASPWQCRITRDALIYLKGRPIEAEIVKSLQARFPSHIVIRHGRFDRPALLEAARTSRVCFYVSRIDHYPSAAVEIGLMGCPIVSDERACPVIHHRLTGLSAAVRERGAQAGFAWAPDAAERLAAEWEAAAEINRAAIRAAVARRHAPGMAVRRVAAALGLNTIACQETRQ